MFTLSTEHQHKVFKTSVSGIFSSDDIAGLDEAVLVFTARHGPARGLIDFSLVEAVAVPMSKLIARGQQPQIIADRERVMVIPCRAWGD